MLILISYFLQLEPPYIPTLHSDDDLANFDSMFTEEAPVITPDDATELARYVCLCVCLCTSDILESGYIDLEYSVKYHDKSLSYRIDQSEFEGFEYINPLLLNKEEAV